MNPAQEAAYKQGRAAREAGRPKEPPAELDAVKRGFWLAGWIDRDIEFGERAWKE